MYLASSIAFIFTRKRVYKGVYKLYLFISSAGAYYPLKWLSCPTSIILIVRAYTNRNPLDIPIKRVISCRRLTLPGTDGIPIDQNVKPIAYCIGCRPSSIASPLMKRSRTSPYNFLVPHYSPIHLHAALR